MATLEKIRSKAGILIAIVIGIALLAFVIQDFFDSRSSVFFNPIGDVGKIADKTITTKLMDEKIEELTRLFKEKYNQTPNDKATENIREQAWQYFVFEYAFIEECQKIGLTVSVDELNDLFLGSNPDPIVVQNFVNRDGQFDPAMVRNFINNLRNKNDDTPTPEVYLELEEQVINSRLQNKYISLIKNGITVPTFIAKNDYVETDKKVNVNFIVQRYGTVADSTIKITPTDLKNYYNEHKYLYQQAENAREVEYVVFEMKPSNDDINKTLSAITNVKADFEISNQVDTVVNPHSDNVYEDLNFKKDELSDTVQKFIASAKNGAVCGPYMEDGSYKLAKLIKEVNLPDSVKVRHIFIDRGKTPAEDNTKRLLVDSIKLAIKKGASFEALARKYSYDTTELNSITGVWINYKTEYGKVLGDSVFSFAKNEIRVDSSANGFEILQIIDKTEDVKKYKIAFIERKLYPSNETTDSVYSAARKFAAENTTYEQFITAINKQNLFKKYFSVQQGQRNVGSGLESEEILLNWVFKNKKGDISEPLSLKSNYVVAAITEVREKGTIPLNLVKDRVEFAVRNQKKAEKLIANINNVRGGANTIQDIALKLNTTVETAENISFVSPILGNAGYEPKIVALATNLPKDKLSDPFQGDNGVYVLIVNNITENPVADFSANISRMNSIMISRFSRDGFGALLKLANIEDNRILFNY